METLWKDIRYGARMLWRTPGVTLAAVAAIALGIGANTAIFSAVWGVLLRPLPYPDPDRLVFVWEKFEARKRLRNVVSPANYLDWRKQSQSFQALAALNEFPANLTGAFEPEEIQSQSVTADFFALLGARPQFGRVFTNQETLPGAPVVAVISHGLWQRRYGGDRDLVGRTITVNAQPATVVGILPPGFFFRNPRTEIWLPFRLDPARDYRRTSGRFMNVIASLKAGVSITQAQSEMDLIARRLEQDHVDFNKGWGVNIVGMHEHLSGELSRPLWVLLAAVGLVLFIACANVANLLLARAAARRREIAIRTSLGAGRTRIVRQLLTESVLLSVLGGACGLLLAVWGLDLLAGVLPKSIPLIPVLRLDRVVLAFTVVVSLATGVLFGLAPAVWAARSELNEALRDGGDRSGKGRQRVREALVVAEVALSVVLLAGAGLLLRSFWRLIQVDPGFRSDHVLTMRIQLPPAIYSDAGRRIAFYAQAVESVAGVPGVIGAGAVNWVPFGGNISGTRFQVVGRPVPEPDKALVTRVLVVTPGYFHTMGIPLIKGRLFDRRDTADAPRAYLVNQTMARRNFPNEDPIGRRLVVSMGDDVPGEIVGIVGDTRHMSLDDEESPMVYYTHSHLAMTFMTLVARTSVEPEALARQIVAALRPLDPGQPIADVRPLEGIVSDSVWRQRLIAGLLAIFAGVALLLASVGIYGVMSYSVTERTRELGLRMAVGARPADVLGQVLTRGMTMAGAGLAIGLAAAFGVTRLLSTLLFGVTPGDPATYGVAAATLLFVALVACLIPALRATRIDPMEALRHE